MRGFIGMIVAGLTGSIAAGKSTIASMFTALGCPVFDADAAVREFYQSDGAVVIEAAFPGVVVNGIVDRQLLAARALTAPSTMSQLESIVHPAVAIRQSGFLQSACCKGRNLALLDIPLLFETGGDGSVDLVIVVSSSAENQRARALSRGGMTTSKFDSILARQIPDGDKRKRAHFVIDTNKSLAESAAQVAGIVRAIAGMSGKGVFDA
jgi:dephospho-CoA kinase